MNHAGLSMDTREHGFYDRIASIGLLKKIAEFLPNKVKDLIRPDHETPAPVSSQDREEIAALLERLHGNGKGVKVPRWITVYRCHNRRHARRTGIAKEL
jgi:hypothetical protein